MHICDILIECLHGKNDIFVVCIFPHFVTFNVQYYKQLYLKNSPY